MRRKKSKQHQIRLISFIKVVLTILISVLIIFTVAKAGTITPPAGDPSAQFYTLSEIYTRLTANATSAEGGHGFTFSDALAGTHYTLTQIYNAIPTIDATKLLDDTTYLGITGNIATQTLSAATTTVNTGYYVATTLDSVDTDLISGSIKSGANLFGVDGDSNVVDTSSGNAVAGDICSSKVAWVDGSEITGNRTACQSCAAGTANANTILSGKTADYDCDGTAESGSASYVAMDAPHGTTCNTKCASVGLSCAGSAHGPCENIDQGGWNCTTNSDTRCCICN